MKTIPISKVVIPANRIRKTFEDAEIEELAASILEVGLIHLPVLRGKNTLVSGERRYRAMLWIHNQQLPMKYLDKEVRPNFMPFAAFEDLGEESARELELHENARRVDIPWQIIAEATAQLHALRQIADPSWHPTQTAKELGFSSPEKQQTIINERIVLAQNLHRPEVRSAKSERDAKKILNRSMERDFSAELRRRQPQKKSKHTLIHGEAEDQLGLLEASNGEYYDVIISDPPYGIDSQRFGIPRTSNRPSHKYDDSAERALEHYVTLADLGFRVTKKQAHIYLFCDFTLTFTILDMLSNYGWETWPRPIIWYKHVGNLPKPDLGPQYVHEYILFASKGKKPTAGLWPDVIDCKAVQDKQYAAEKPVEVYRNLLQRSIKPGDKVLDPFCGSGPIFPAAESLHCTATGIDNDEDAIALSKERINKLDGE